MPLPGKVLLSSNRDESPARLPAAHPSYKKGQNGTLLYPTDGAAGGTWIGMNSSGYLLIVLNGGFENHIRKDKYRKSRGLIAKEMLDSPDPVSAWHGTNLQDIEPFTVIIYKRTTLHQLVWNGEQKIHLHPSPSQYHIWSSATLYPVAVREAREKWFRQFVLVNPAARTGDLRDFLLHNPPDDIENAFTMNRNEQVKTCSISIVEIKDGKAVFEYSDLLQESFSTHDFFFDEAQSDSASNSLDKYAKKAIGEATGGLFEWAIN